MGINIYVNGKMTKTNKHNGKYIKAVASKFHSNILLQIAIQLIINSSI